MSYLSQLQPVDSTVTQKRKKEYIAYNFGTYLSPRFQKNNIHILEIGPGCGEFIEYCLERGIKNIDVVENDASVVNYLKEKYKLRNILFTQNISEIDYKLDKYDVIMMTQVFEHIPQVEHMKVLQTLYRHLNVKGVLIITVPNVGNPLAIFERYYDYTHRTAFTEHSLEQMVDLADLKNARIILQPFRIPPHSLINILRIIPQFLLHALFKLLYIVNGGVYPRILTTNVSLILEKTS